MIRSEIQQLDTLITSFRNARTIGDQDYLTAVAAQCESVKNRWLQRLFSSASEVVLIRYVHFHQAGVTALSDRIWQSPEPNDSFILAITARLEELIDFLKDSFYHYFDNRQPMSLSRCAAIVSELTAMFQTTLIALKESSVDQSLIRAIEHAVAHKLQDAKHNSIGFQQAEVLRARLRKISELAQLSETEVTQVIAQELHLQNFNSPYFTAWYQEYLEDRIARAAEKERTGKVQHEIKFLENLFTDPDKAFDPELPASNDQVLRWLKKLAPADQQMAPNLKHDPERLPLLCSVPQFAFFVRLCYLAGCFPVQNISAIVRFFTSHFETKKQPHVSVKSFGRAFYSTDQATAAVVRDLLQRMINTINKTYFPK